MVRETVESRGKGKDGGPRKGGSAWGQRSWTVAAPRRTSWLGKSSWEGRGWEEGVEGRREVEWKTRFGGSARVGLRRRGCHGWSTSSGRVGGIGRGGRRKGEDRGDTEGSRGKEEMKREGPRNHISGAKGDFRRLYSSLSESPPKPFLPTRASMLARDHPPPVCFEPETNAWPLVLRAHATASICNHTQSYFHA